MSNVSKNIIASGFSAGSKLVQKMIGLVSTLVLARILSPDDFGLVALVWVIIMFADAIVDSGSQDYLIQKESIDDTDINTAWTLNVLLKFVVMSILLYVSPLIADFYKQPELVAAIAALVMVVIVGSLKNPHMIVLSRQRNYKPSFKIEVITKIVGVVATIAGAILLRNFWALIIGHMTSTTLRTLLTYAWFSYRPKITLIRVKEQFSFTQWMLLRNVFGYCRSQIDTFLVSAHYGLTILGGYHVTKYVSRLPALEGLVPMMSPLMASFSEVQTDKEQLRYQVSFALLILIALVTPMAATMFFNADVISYILLGEKWVAFTDVFAVFSLSLFILPFYSFAVTLLYIEKKAKQVFYYDLFSFAFLAIVLYLATNASIVNFLVCKIATDLVFVTGFLFYSLRCIGVKHLLISALVFLLVLSFFFLSSYYLRSLISDTVNAFFTLSIFCLCFSLLCIFVYLLVFKLFIANTQIGHHIKYLEKRYIKGVRLFGFL